MSAKVDVAIECIGDRHWRIVWLNNALDVMLREGEGWQEGDPPTLRTRLASRSAKPDPFFVYGDALRRVDAEVRIGVRQTPVVWSSIVARPQERGLHISLSGDGPLRADLTFLVDATGVLIRETAIVHLGGEHILLTGVPSFALSLSDAFSETTFLSGECDEETQVNRVPLAHTPIYLESRSGRTGFEYNPWIALQGPGVTVTAQLFWSGNWHLAARRGPGATYLSGGLPEHGFAHELHAGDRLLLPTVAIVRVEGGIDQATHRLHDYRRATQPNSGRDVPVQFNSWYPHPGEPNIDAMLELIPIARRLNCEVFVLDAGWYTTEHEDPAEDWWMRTGDWIVDSRLFPKGLEQLGNACRAAGLDFGIWFEPEAVSPSSVIGRTHPEWLHQVEGRPSTARAILNLGIDAAREFVRERMFAILRVTQASWLKWDFNTDLRQGGWATGHVGRDPVVAHYEGLYRLQDEIRAAFPSLTLEMCSTGGGRFDGAIMSHAHTNWISDQIQPLRNLSIHFGSQLAHPPSQCNDFLIDWPPKCHKRRMSRGATPDARGNLAFRLQVPMLSSFGISAPVNSWSAAEIEAAAHHVAWYREHVRPRLNAADQYLLTAQPPLDGKGDWAAVWYADKDRKGGVGFFFRLEGAASRTFRLAGLAPDMRYRLRYLNGPTVEATGAELASGLTVSLDATFASAALVVVAAN
ncbi:alpha-galactosidase [Bradyrhizobium sp. 174]|uniref:alpha-galactosidase n=1 Tax=Bradyrhizobium sp. 174 TaxID=2782645 RepID=UPI001FF9D290|nr:alpha-galactosidase [Bradyrhizobium sp. 174]MCK1571893.1 alpha-galactosidase [Bradyrhizobium sp. 174]